MIKYCKTDKRANFFELAFNFLNHLIKGKTRHGVHSPFVYGVIEKCIYSKEKPEYSEQIEKKHKELRADKREIKVTDFGSGFKTNHLSKKHKRKISEIARKSLKSKSQAEILWRLARYFNCDTILELGTCFGITTAYLYKSNNYVNMHTIEGCPQTAKIAESVFYSLGLNNINVYIGNIDNLLIPVLRKIDNPDFVFIDANHTRQATLNYFCTVVDYMNDESIIVIDDIYRSPGMKNAWLEICNHPKVNVTIDLFFMGLVFIRKGLSNENYIIKPVNLLRDIFH